MKLFDNDINVNLLPFDGAVNYYGQIMDQQSADNYFKNLLKEIVWANDEVTIFGKKIITKRKTAWYSDNGISYTYSGSTKNGMPWTKTLLELKSIVEKNCRENFNSCLLNLYHDGSEGMSWHSDDEKELVKDGPIASLSLGAERRFLFRHKKTKKTVELQLANGSLLLMKGTTQTNWLHRLPPSAKIKAPRINLTFRKMLQ